MLSVRRGLAVVVAVMAAMVLTQAPAYADGAGGVKPPNCKTNPHPGCDIGVGDPGTGGGGQPGNGGGSGGGGVCLNPEYAPIPCQRDGRWAGEDGCYYEPANPSDDVIAGLGGQPPGPGGWWLMTCYIKNSTATFQLIRWLVAAPIQVTPAMLARDARAHLSFPNVVISLNPAGTQLVGVPVWVSLAAGWDVRSATASVPGLSATVTARPTQVVISLGNGSSIVCYGPGAVFRPGIDDPSASSPDCGATYWRSSAGQPGEVFRMTATVTWVITWVGGGQSGTVPGLTTTGAVNVRVAEAQTVLPG